MRYLKYFESDRYYWQIASDEFSNEDGDLSITDKDFDYIKDKLINIYKISEKDVLTSTNGSQGCFNVYCNITKYRHFCIYMKEDEYYLVSIYSRPRGRGNTQYYKCDQWEGVERCLKEKCPFNLRK